MPPLQGYVINRDLEETQVGLTVLNNLGKAPIGEDIALFKNNTKNKSTITVVDSNINSVTNTIKFDNSDIVFGTGTKVLFNNYYTYYIKNSNGKDSFQLSALPSLETTVNLSDAFSGIYVRSDEITFENITNYSKKRRSAVDVGVDRFFSAAPYEVNSSQQITIFEKNLETLNSTKINSYLTNTNIVTDLDFNNQGHTVINDPDNFNLAGISPNTGPGIFIYNFVANTKQRAFSDRQNVWQPNLANTYLETTSRKVTVGALKLTKDDAITIEQKAGTSPDIVVQGSGSLNIGPLDFTHTVKTFINGEEYYLCLSNTSSVSAERIIENVGSVQLKVRADGTYGLNVSGTEIQIIYNSAPVVGLVNGYAPIYATTYQSGYAILWKIPDQNSYTVWQLNSSAVWTNNIQTASVGDFEILVNQDANGDGFIGYASLVKVGGTATLKTNNIGEYYVTVNGVDTPPLNYYGTTINARFGIFDGYFITHAEVYDGQLAVLFYNGRAYSVWRMLISTGGYDNVTYLTSGEIEPYEALVNYDVNNDGKIGYERIIENNGNATLKISKSGVYTIVYNGNDISILFPEGAPIGVNNVPLSGYFPVQVEPYNNGFLILWYRPSDNIYVTWFQNLNGSYNSSPNIYSLEAFETATNSDANGNGIIGA